MHDKEQNLSEEKCICKSQNDFVYKISNYCKIPVSDIDELIFPEDEPRYISER